MDRSRVCKEKVADSKISGYVVDGAQEYYSPTTNRAGEALVSTTCSYIFIYVSKHVLVACRPKASITLFFHCSLLHFNDLRSMNPN